MSQSKPKMVDPATINKLAKTQNEDAKVSKKHITIPKDREEFFKEFGFYKEDTNVLICTPCYGGLMYNGYFHSFIQTTQFLSQVGIKFGMKTIGNESLITRARNTCVAYFLTHTEYTHLLFIDADISWEPVNILKLLHANKDVISAVYPKKGYNFGKLPQLVQNDPEWANDLSTKLVDYVVNFESAEIKIEKNCVKVKDAPTGFMLIKRGTIEALKRKFPDMQYNNDLQNLNINDYHPDSFWLFFDCMKDPRDGRYLSEDYAFCRLVQQAELECWVEITCPLSHTGTHTFSGNIINSFTFE